MSPSTEKTGKSVRAMNRSIGALTDWATWEVVRSMGGSLNDIRQRRSQLRYAMEVA